MLHQITGDANFLDAARRTNAYVRERVRVEGAPEMRGGVKGSFPVDGEYGKFEYLSWACKFFIDANILEQELGVDRLALVPTPRRPLLSRDATEQGARPPSSSSAQSHASSSRSRARCSAPACDASSPSRAGSRCACRRARSPSLVRFAATRGIRGRARAPRAIRARGMGGAHERQLAADRLRRLRRVSHASARWARRHRRSCSACSTRRSRSRSRSGAACRFRRR